MKLCRGFIRWYHRWNSNPFYMLPVRPRFVLMRFGEAQVEEAEFISVMQSPATTLMAMSGRHRRAAWHAMQKVLAPIPNI